MSTLTNIAQFIEGLFTHDHLAAMVAGFLISTGFTQLAKYPVRLFFYCKGKNPHSRLTPAIEVELHRWTIRLIAVLAGAIATFIAWPSTSPGYRLVWSLAIGLACPTAYSIVVHFFPWLADKASADKVIKS